jgi:hypothetical protein
MGTARRQFTDEFKREAVGLLASRGRPLNQIAQSWELPLRGCAPGGTGMTGACGIAAALQHAGGDPACRYGFGHGKRPVAARE